MPKARIVVVEDEPAIRRGVSDALRLSGYEVTEAPDGAVGLREGGAAGVDLVLLDLLLPKRDGLDVLAELRRTCPTRPVIILTARGSEDDRVRGLKMGADDYVVKPFSAKELIARVEAVLRRTLKPIPEVRLVKIGKGTIDLDKEAVDLTFETRPKDPSIFSSRAPLYVAGTLKSPDFSVDKTVIAGRIGAAVALGVLATPLAALVPLIETGPGKDTNCAALFAEENKRQTTNAK